MAPEGGVGQLKKSGAQASEEIVEGLAVCGLFFYNLKMCSWILGHGVRRLSSDVLFP